MWPKPRLIATVVVGLIVFGASACTRAESTVTDPELQALKTILDDARAADVAPEQIEALEEAIQTGELKYEPLVELTELAISCMNEAGLDAFRVQDRVIGQLNIPDFGVREGQGQTEEVALQLSFGCFSEYVGYARNFYESQPVAQELLVSAIEDRRPEVTSCLIQRGYTADEMADTASLVAVLNRDIDEHGGDAGFLPCYEGQLPAT